MLTGTPACARRVDFIGSSSGKKSFVKLYSSRTFLAAGGSCADEMKWKEERTKLSGISRIVFHGRIHRPARRVRFLPSAGPLNGKKKNISHLFFRRTESHNRRTCSATCPSFAASSLGS